MLLLIILIFAVPMACSFINGVGSAVQTWAPIVEEQNKKQLPVDPNKGRRMYDSL